MEANELDDLVALVTPLLRSLETLNLATRHLHPYQLQRLVRAMGEPDAPLREALPRLAAWPDSLADIRGMLSLASEETLAAFDALRAAADDPDGAMGAFMAFRHVPRALEALYPLAGGLPPVNRFFLHPDKRADADLQRRLLEPAPEGTGVAHVRNEGEERGGFSLYVPEYYDAGREWPIVFALHGGSGHGRGFLWSWLRDARSFGAILVAPTSVGRTWSLAGPDLDTANLAQMLDFVRERWRIDPKRLLLTGLSDGGTFSYVTGLEAGSPFTHLAPVAAAFNPMLTEFADAGRIRGLPIHVVHGALDWMFPVEMARGAERSLRAAGADVIYTEIADLPHTYPREVNAGLLAWLGETAR